MRFVNLFLPFLIATPASAECVETCQEVIRVICPSPGEPDQCYEVVEEICQTTCTFEPSEDAINQWIEEGANPAEFPGSLDDFLSIPDSRLPDFNNSDGSDYGPPPDGLGGGIGGSGY